MHEANRKAWQYFKEKYPNYFSDTSVLEVGSFNVNGSVRDYFKAKKYIGVDWRAGPHVDLVCFAHEMNFEEKFDIVISASMLEHDPYWEKSIPAMINCMKDDGILLLSWGAARNQPHEHEASPDLCFHSLPAGKVINALKDLCVSDFYYEINVPGVNPIDCCDGFGMKGYGEVVLAAFKDKKYAKEIHLDKLIQEDQC